MSVRIFHNPACSTSRNALALIRERGIEPDITEYLKTPLSRAELTELVEAMGIPVIELIRVKQPEFTALGLSTDSTADQLYDAMVSHPILMNRPVVVTDHGARLCRPSETVLELLDRGS